MTVAQTVFLAVSAAMFTGGAAPAPVPVLTFEQRVEAQRAIERARYRHQIGTVMPFEEAVTDDVLRKKVTTYLKQSVALEELWDTPVTAEMLRAEAERMARNSRMPERFLELRQALDDDPLLIQECLARPALVDRLARARFSSDPAIHSDGKTSFDDWWSGVESTLDETRVETVADPDVDLMLDRAASCAGWRWTGALPGVPDPRNLHTAVWTGSTMIVWGGAGGGSTGAQYDPAVDIWSGVSTLGAPSPRIFHTAVWTGSHMLIWGGGATDAAGAVDAGARYDPLSDTWTPISEVGAPSPRTLHSAVWTGSRMIVWGGVVNSGPPASGGLYDPATDTWMSVSESGAPTARTLHAAVWTGSEMVIWGGSGGGVTGGRYDPATETWSPTSLVNAPSARKFFTWVWTGSEMIVWGGEDSNQVLIASGGVYDPHHDRWDATSMTNAPSARFLHTAVWTGSRMIVWGGLNVGGLNSGGLYDPASDQWVATSLTAPPNGRSHHTAVWTGTEMIVWGGRNSLGQSFNTGGRYAPASGTWTPTAVRPAFGHTSVWTGNEMIVWGGTFDSAGDFLEGSRYDPVTDAWRPTSLAGAPVPRHGHVAVWTGSRMVVWGGRNFPAAGSRNTGGRYDPISDTWQSTTTTGAPFDGTGLAAFSAVWTGSRMIVWGYHWTATGITNAGGRYDPVGDAWAPVSLAGAPVVRDEDHSAVWTGSRMVIWGGSTDPSQGWPPAARFNSGGRYDPVSNAWAPTSPAPEGRSAHSAVWTGSRMIVWGGLGQSGYAGPGRRYDPVANTWAAISTTGAPSNRVGHSAVWTGEEMIVWGGTSDRTGGRYDPASNTWQPTPALGAPGSQNTRTEVWTGTAMIVWGGPGLGGGILEAGPSPDDDLDGFTVCDGDCDDANPAVRPGGPQICDGLNNDCLAPGWPSLTGTNEADGDGDGYSVCQLECDDANPAVRPGGPQVCDGLNNDCLAPGWPSLTGTNEADVDGDGYSVCQLDCNDEDPSSWHPPGDVDLRFLADGETMIWQPPDLPGSTALRYDILRFEHGYPMPTFGSAECRGEDTTSLSFTDPVGRELSFFLVRAENGCGHGPAGFSSTGAEILLRSCP